jgi:uncharacterized protein (DUF305 family)
LPAVTAPTASGPVVQPGRPGEPNATLTGTAAAPITTPTVNPVDATFYQDMIVHHAQAIVMVESVQSRLTDAQVTALASRIAAEQEPEIDAMAKWLKDKEQDVPAQATNPRLGDHDHGGMPGMASPAQLASLAKANGVEADRLFLQMMIRHHEGALDMVGVHGRGGTDDFVTQMAAEINVTQDKQIQQMQAMLARLT